MTRWLFSTNHKDIRTLYFQNQTLLFFFQIGLCVFSFCLFIFSYSFMFPSIETGSLPNPPQVLTQLFAFFYLFKYTAVRKRHLLLLCLFLSFSSSLYLKGLGLVYIILFFFFYFLIIIYIFPFDSDLALFFFFSFYCFDIDMSKWGFYLIFQQGCFFLLELFFSKSPPCGHPKKLFFYFLCIETILLCTGLIHYNAFYLKQPFELAILLSGASIIYLCFKRRNQLEFVFCFCLYLVISFCFGIFISPTKLLTLGGIPNGIFIFLALHLWALFGLIFFWDRLPKRKHALVPIFFSALFYFLGFMPELACLEKWISGIDLLLCFLCIFSLLEEETYFKRRVRTKNSRSKDPQE